MTQRPPAAAILFRLNGIKDRFASPARRTPGWDAIARRDIVEALLLYHCPGERAPPGGTMTDVFLEHAIRSFTNLAEAERDHSTLSP